MKNIKDYLHLYYEGKVFAKFNDGSSGEMDLNVYYLRYPDIDPLPIEFKLILRPLSDMTEDEAIKLCSIVSPTIFGDFRYKKWTVTKEREWDSTQKNYTVKREGDDHSFEVDCLDGDILLWEDNKMIDSPYMNFNYRFEYLKMGFDIFGLIESGLAIDATKLKISSIA